MTEKELENYIDSLLFKDGQEGMVIGTGHGGLKDYLKVVCEVHNFEYNWIGMRKAYRFLQINRGITKIGRNYILRA